MTRIEQSTSNHYVKLILDVNETATNIANNTSDLSWTLTLAGDTSYAYSYDNTSLAEVEINGQAVHSSTHNFNTQNGAVQLASGTLTVPHNEDGSKTIQIWARMMNVSYYGNIDWFSGNMTLTKIPRASQINDNALSGNRQLGSEHILTLAKKADRFTHQVWYRVFGSDWIDLGKNHGNSVRFTPPLSLAQHSPNSRDGKMDICVRTYDGGTQVGRDEYSNGWYFGIPETVKPRLSSITMSETTENVRKHMTSNMFVQTLSVPSITFNGANGVYGSTIKAFHATIGDDKSYVVIENGGKFSYLKNSGHFTVKAYVVDSRGVKSDTVQMQINVLPYFPPTLSFNLERSNGGANTLTVTRNARIAPLTVNGSQKNQLKLTFKTRPVTTSYFSDNSGAGITTNSLSSLINSRANLSGTFSAAQSFEVEATLSDLFLSVSVKQSVGPESVVLSYAPTGVGVGKVWERGTLDVAGTSYFKDKMYLNNKEIKAAIDLKLSDMYKSSSFDAVCPRGTNLSNFLRSDKVGNGLSLIRDENTSKSSIVIKENSNHIYGFVPLKGRIETFAMINGTLFTYQGMNFEEPTWHNASLTSGWQHDTSYGHVQYSKSADGTVFMRGSAKGGRTSGETLIFTLPVGYRPTQFLYKSTLNNSYGTAVLGIGESGQVVVKGNVDSTWLNFDNVSFRI